MSVESARAFCVRMMSDEEFRKETGSKASLAELDALIKGGGYDFKKAELVKAIGEFAGKKLADDELVKVVCSFYEEQSAQGGAAAAQGRDTVIQWLKALQ